MQISFKLQFEADCLVYPNLILTQSPQTSDYAKIVNNLTLYNLFWSITILARKSLYNCWKQCLNKFSIRRQCIELIVFYKSTNSILLNATCKSFIILVSFVIVNIDFGEKLKERRLKLSRKVQLFLKQYQSQTITLFLSTLLSLIEQII